MKRIAVIDRNKCIREKCGYICRNVCPPVRMGIDAIVIDEKGWPVIDENLCTGCGICPKKCPVEAIKVINLAGEAGIPLHQYGVNAFRIYNFAVPQKSAVTALIGRNGIGKTTLLNILSGKTVPNFFDYSKTYELNDAIKNIRQRELKNYFSLLESGYKVSYKVQNVELLAKVAPGRLVSEVLSEFDERGVKNEIMDRLSMSNFANSKLSSLSGGELQKVAVAAALVKDADLYFFDEPSTYLDIYERMRVAREILRLSERKAVFVVEHDLAILDYLANYAYIIYGEPGAYGVVSGIKNARNGINEFVEGYLKEENVRFRDYALKFELYSAGESKEREHLSYGAMAKEYEHFKLKVEGGSVRQGEVIGIVGPNAIGKSTFIKLIGGVELPDEGRQMEGVRVSYKPQYIKTDYEGTVIDYIKANGISELYIKEFELDHLLHKAVAKLSGGELQRLEVAAALSRDADIYLFDEPSAFLDVEQRMRLSTIIRRDIAGKEKAAFVVDHDIVFIDSISSRIMQFSGEPSVEGSAGSPAEKHVAMNAFLKDLDITLRRDKGTKRPKINKKDSILDRKQRESGNYYYFS